MNSLNSLQRTLYIFFIKHKISVFYVLCALSFFPPAGFSSTNTIQNLRGSGLCFTENKGQVTEIDKGQRPDILFTAEGAELSLFIRQTGISYVLHKSHEIPEDALTEEEQYNNYYFYTHRIDLDFSGCNYNSKIEKLNPVEGYKNFYYSHCPDGINNVKSYNTLIQKNIYNNIDIIYRGGKSEGLKYDFIVNPGGNIQNIVLAYSGYKQLTVEDGNIMISTSLGELIEYMPKVYQEKNGKIIPIKAWYEKTKNNHIIIKTGGYDKSYSLVIDPWVTYFGGSQNDDPASITTDASGNVVFLGTTASVNLPALGAYQGTFAGNMDMFVGKMDANGNLLWSTFYGGSSSDRGTGICTDKITGDVYFTGLSAGTFPTGASTGQISIMPAFPGVTSPVVVKLGASGTRLWATYYGHSSGAGKGTDVTTDRNNNLILMGNTKATSNITTPGTFQVNHSGGTFDDAFVAKFNPTGVLQWASYCGGSTGNEINGMVNCDANNNIYISGLTTSTDFPASAGHQLTSGGGRDAFLFKFDASGQRLWGTYFGGTANEGRISESIAVQTDLSGYVYLGGCSFSSTGIATAGSYQSNKSATTTDGFLAKFNSAGVLQWSTYLGGTTANQHSYITGLDIDKNNNIILGGDTYCSDFPTTTCSYQTSLQGREGQFIASFDSVGNLLCSSYYGQLNNVAYTLDNETGEQQGGGSIVVSGAYVYLITRTQCNYPVTAGAYQTACGGFYDAAISKICLPTCGLPTPTIINFSANKTTICPGDSISFTQQSTACSQSGVRYQWTFNGATPATSTNANPSNIIYNSTGTYPVKVVIETECGKDSTQTLAYINVSSTPAVSITADTMVCPGNTINLTAGGGTTYLWSTGNSNSSITVTPTITTTYSLIANSNCGADTNTVLITVHNLPTVICSGDIKFCAGETSTLTASGGNTYSWLPSTGLSSATGNSVNASPLSTIQYTVIATDINGCTNFCTINLSQHPIAVVDAGENTTIVRGEKTQLSASGTGTHQWLPLEGLSCTNCPNPLASPITTTKYYILFTDTNGCTAMDSVVITVDISCGYVFTPNVFSPNNDGQNDIFYVEAKAECINNFIFTIYNRWGEKMFETNNITEGWDGKYKGKELETDVFVYIISYNLSDGIDIISKGNITLLK